MSSQKPKKQSSKSKALSAYGRYSGLAIQIVIVVVLFAWLGVKLDEWTGTEIPGWTVGLTLVGIIGSLYYLYKQVTRTDK